jgi:hypothetical protein
MIGATLAYVLSDFGDWPRLTYWPIRNRWAFADRDHAEAIQYWGGLLWAVGGAAVGTVVAQALRIALPTTTQRKAIITLLGAWSMAAVLIGALYFTWMLWP